MKPALAPGQPPSPDAPTPSTPYQPSAADTQVFVELVGGLSMQPVQLPASWLPLLQDLTALHLHALSAPQLVQVLQVRAGKGAHVLVRLLAHSLARLMTGWLLVLLLCSCLQLTCTASCCCLRLLGCSWQALHTH